MLIQLQFKCVKGLSWPTLSFNNSVETKVIPVDEYTQTILVTCQSSNQVIFVNRTGKTGQETIVVDGNIVRDQTVTLEKIWVDEILLDIDMILEEACFVNDFPLDYIEYCKKQNIALAATESHWNTWYFNGVWTYKFNVPFWPWYFKKRKEKQFKYHSEKDREMFIGSNEHQSLLGELKKLLSDAV
jgi:hypothetical protein